MGSRAFCRKKEKILTMLFLFSRMTYCYLMYSVLLTYLVEWMFSRIRTYWVTVVVIDASCLYCYSNCFRVSLLFPCWFQPNIVLFQEPKHFFVPLGALSDVMDDVSCTAPLSVTCHFNLSHTVRIDPDLTVQRENCATQWSPSLNLARSGRHAW